MRKTTLFLLADVVVAAVAVLAILVLLPRGGHAPPAQPKPEAATGSLVYLKDRDLWVAPIDGKTASLRLTYGSIGAGYAGYVRRADGGIDIYYTSQESGDRDGGSFAVYRSDLAGGDAVNVVEFPGSSKNAEFYCCNASVSPNGMSLAYVDESGLRLLDLRSGRTSLVVHNGLSVNCSPSSSECFGNYFPLWSPTSDAIAFVRIYYEGSDLFLLRPFSPSPGETRIGRDGFAYRSWSPDGKEMCSQIGLSEHDGNSPRTRDVISGKSFLLSSALLPPLKSAPLVNAGSGCAWSPDGRIAFSYIGEGLSQHVAVLDRGRKLAALLDGGPVVGWLPDGSGVIFRAVPNPLEPQDRYRVWNTGGYPVRLPVDADQILAIVPG